jgi:hypothetical protein
MPRQRQLSLGDQEVPEALWERFPRESRRQVVKLYARLIGRVADSRAMRITQEETKHEPNADRSVQQDSR